MTAMTQRDAWQVLGIPPASDPDTIREAYRARARELHPDAGGTREQWDELQEAYAMLAAFGATSEDPSESAERKAEKTARWWRLRSRRLRLAIVGGTGLVVLPVVTYAWIHTMSPPIPWQVPAVMMSYVGGWWAWLLLFEFRRPTVRPLRWYFLRIPSDPSEREEFFRAVRRSSERSSQQSRDEGSSPRAGDL